MEVKIGVQHAARELVIESNDDADSVEKLIREALDSDGALTLVDNKGRRTIVAASRISYVEIGGGVAGQVGFRS